MACQWDTISSIYTTFNQQETIVVGEHCVNGFKRLHPSTNWAIVLLGNHYTSMKSLIFSFIANALPVPNVGYLSMVFPIFAI